MDIDDIFEDGGFFNDDGTEIDVSKVPIPLLCLSCVSFGMRGEEYVLCTLNRAGQQHEKVFRCGAYRLEDSPRESRHGQEICGMKGRRQGAVALCVWIVVDFIHLLEKMRPISTGRLQFSRNRSWTACPSRAMGMAPGPPSPFPCDR